MEERETRISRDFVDEARFITYGLPAQLDVVWDDYVEEKDGRAFGEFWAYIEEYYLYDRDEFMMITHLSYDDWHRRIKEEKTLDKKIFDRLVIIAKFIVDYFECNAHVFKTFFNADKEFKKIVVGTKVGEIDSKALKQWGEEHREEICGEIKYLEDQCEKLKYIYYSHLRKTS